MTTSIDLTWCVVSPDELEHVAPYLHRDDIARAVKQVAELNERSAEQVLIVELQRRLSVAEAKLAEMESQPVPADKPARITEQDALAIAQSALMFWRNTVNLTLDRWLKDNAPPLLNKLNAEREQVQAVKVPEIIEAVANFVGSQEGGPFTPVAIKAAIIGQLKYGDAFTKLSTSTAPSHSQQSEGANKCRT